MRRMMLALLMCGMAVGIVRADPTHATVPDAVRKALQERFRLSPVAVDSKLVEGRVFTPGTILILQTDGVPAKKFRVVQHLNYLGKVPTWTRFHVRDYAPVTIGADGRLMAPPGDFTLEKGTRLVVLDLRVKLDRVRLLTHTLDPVRLVDGRAVYGCTEFIFLFDSSALARDDPAAIFGRIEQWLAVAPAK